MGAAAGERLGGYDVRMNRRSFIGGMFGCLGFQPQRGLWPWQRAASPPRRTIEFVWRTWVSLLLSGYEFQTPSSDQTPLPLAKCFPDPLKARKCRLGACLRGKLRHTWCQAGSPEIHRGRPPLQIMQGHSPVSS